MAGNHPGGGLDWDLYNYISMAPLPNGQSPNSIREIFNFYLLRHLREQVPDVYATVSGIPADDDRTAGSVAARAVAVQALGAAVVAAAQALRGKGDASAVEALRVRLFVANQHAVIDALRVEQSTRYLPSKDGKTTFCNVYAYDVVTAMGGYLPRVWWTQRGLDALDAGATVVSAKDYAARQNDKDSTNDNVVTNESPFTEQVDANGLDDWMVRWGSAYGWQAVKTPQAAQAAANAGTIVVITATTGTDQLAGHISVVLAETAQRQRPDESQTNGDYVPLQSQAGAQNFTSNAKDVSGIGQTGRSQWWTDPKFTHAGLWAYRGVPRATAVQRPDLVGAALPG
jgi:hypothetical protein